MQTWMNKFVKKIMPSQRAFQEADRQSNFMIKELEGKIDQQEGLTIARVMIAGSNATHTTIRRTDSTDFDVDVSVYLEGDNVEDIRLRPFLRRKLIEIYPTKDHEDFDTRRSAVMVKFRSGIRLNVDVVPIVLDKTKPRNEWWGYIPQPSGNRLITSVPKHINFVRSRTSQSNAPAKFNNMIRIMKWWSKLHELKATSFAITSLTGYSFNEQTFSNQWSDVLIQVFNYYHSSWTTDQNLETPVRIRDPINPDNNAAYNWTTTDLNNFKSQAKQAETIVRQAKHVYQQNDKGKSTRLLQNIFGSEFNNL